MRELLQSHGTCDINYPLTDAYQVTGRQAPTYLGPGATYGKCLLSDFINFIGPKQQNRPMRSSPLKDNVANVQVWSSHEKRNMAVQEKHQSNMTTSVTSA